MLANLSNPRIERCWQTIVRNRAGVRLPLPSAFLRAIRGPLFSIPQ